MRYAKKNGEEPLSGVGFLEAKVAHLLRPRYEAIKWEQLQRICKHTRYSMLLLYNHRKIGGYGDNVAFQKYSADGEGGVYSTMNSYACTLQTLTALRVSRTDDGLHPHAIPLSHQLCNRYLRFMDLETDPAILDAVQGWLKEYGSPTFLLVATVAFDETTTAPPKVNEDIYEEIGKDESSGRGGGSGGGTPGAPKPNPKSHGEAKELPGYETADAVTRLEEAEEATTTHENAVVSAS